LKYVQFEKLARQDTRIFIKPNLTYPTFRPGVMTTLEALEAAIVAVKDYTSHIYLGDADSGGYNPFPMEEVYRETGVEELAKRYGVKIVNLSRGPRQAIHFTCQGKNISLDLPVLLMEDMDFLITMPVPKIHNMTGVSLTFKNQWGCIPEPRDRLRLHPFFKHVIQEVNKAVKARVAIIDGRFGLNLNGPMKGQPVELNWALITDNIGAGARLACELMQVPLEKIRHLKYAQKLGNIPEREQIQVNCELQPFIKNKFTLERVWTDLPGFLAFRSSFISYIAYFSPLAGFLHRLLYLFREPFYDYEKYSHRR
jgi:uncharacterized protein (DUF362 family)